MKFLNQPLVWFLICPFIKVREVKFLVIQEKEMSFQIKEKNFKRIYQSTSK